MTFRSAALFYNYDMIFEGMKQNTKTVFLFVSKPAFIGDLLKTQYINYLSSQYGVVVFTPEIDQNNVVVRGFSQLPNVVYVKWSVVNNLLFGLMKFLRFSCIREFDYLATTQFYRHRRGENEEKALLRTLSKPFSRLLTSRFFFKLELLLLKRSRRFTEYCKQYDPVLVLVATPGLNNMEAEAIMLAKLHGIKSVSVDCNWDGLTTRVTRVRPTDYFIAWHEPMRQEAIAIHKYDSARVFVSGPMRFDYYFSHESNAPSQDQFLRSKNLNPQQKTIFYTTQKGHVFEEDFCRRLLILRDSGQIPYTNILIRVHPLAVPNRFREFSGYKDVCVEKPNTVMSKDDLLNLKYSLLYTDLNINYASTMSLEAIAFDKPVINYYEPTMPIFDYNHYKPLVDEGAVKLVRNPQELIDGIGEYLKNPALNHKNRKNIADTYFLSRDGLAHKRNVDLLRKIIDS